MSILTEFHKQNFTEASSIIGTSSLVISGGDSVPVVISEARQSRESEINGFQASSSLRVVADHKAFVDVYTSQADSYLGKICTLDGASWRIDSIEQGISYVILDLISPREVS